MAYSFLTPQNVFKRYEESKRYTEQLTQPFPEFERIARNRPFEGIDPAYPKTTDGTTASIVRKTPRRIIQQLPTGSVITEDQGWLGIVADFIYNNKILPYANEEYEVIQKCWEVIEKGLTFGACCTFTPFLNHDGYFCPDLVVPYWGDVFIQKGKKSGYSCSYTFIRAWWQKDDIKALIDQENKRGAAAKKRGETYEPTWDTQALQAVLDAQTAKDSHGISPYEKERGLDTTAVELVTAFQKGVGAKFYTFCPSAHQVVRTKVNKDPRGKMPVDWFYGDIDGTNPLGRGIVELIGGLQNLIDSDMQMYQYNRALALAPPLIVYGNVNGVKFAPNAIIEAGNPATDRVEALTVDTSALINYPNLYGLQKSQLLNLINSPDTSISSEVGNPNFSKTTAGVQAQQATISVDDNYITKMFETFWRNWSEGAINQYFAGRSGTEILQLDKTTAARLRELPDFDQSLLNDKNQIIIDYDVETPALKFRVDPNTTRVKDAAAQVQDATNLLDLVMKYPMLNSSYGGLVDTDVLARRIVVNSGIDDPEQVAPEPTEAQKQAKEQAKNSPNPFSPMFDKPSIKASIQDMPVAAQVQAYAMMGIQVTAQDILQGPVLDPNIRGVMNPANDPNVLIPGGQPGQPVQQTSNGQLPGAPAPVDLGDIYKQTTDPTIKAEIEQLAGLHPDLGNVQAQVATNVTNHVAQQAEGVTKLAAATQPQPQQQQQSAQQPNDEQQIAQHMQHLGFSPQAIDQALSMSRQGANEQQIAQALGVAHA